MKIPSFVPIALLIVTSITGWMLAAMYASFFHQASKNQYDAIANTTEEIQNMKNYHTMFILCDSNLNVLMDAVTNYMHREYR